MFTSVFLAVVLIVCSFWQFVGAVAIANDKFSRSTVLKAMGLSVLGSFFLVMAFVNIVQIAIKLTP